MPQAPVDLSPFMASMAALSNNVNMVMIEIGKQFQRSLISLTNLSIALMQPVLIIDDPSLCRKGSILRQMRDIVLHEFWMAAGSPERSPGARWVSPAYDSIEISEDFRKQTQHMSKVTGMSAIEAAKTLERNILAMNMAAHKPLGRHHY